MKKFKYILFILVLFLGMNKVYAAGGGGGHSFDVDNLNCYYNIAIEGHKWTKMKCSFYDDGEYTCTLSNSTNETKTEKFERFNDSVWVKTTIKDKGIASNTQCPYITYTVTSTGIELYGFTNNSDAWLKQQDRLKYNSDVVVLSGSPNEDGSTTICKTGYSAHDCISRYGSDAWNGSQCCYDPNGNSVEAKIKEYNQNLSRVGVDSELDEYCILESTGIYRFATTGEQKSYYVTQCQDAKRVMLDYINEANDYVTDAVSEGKISEDNATVQEFFELSNKVRLSLGKTTITGNGEAEQIREVDFSEVIAEKRAAKEREKDEQGRKIEDCKGLIGDNTLKLLNLVLNFLMIIGPIIALVLGTYDLIVALANGEEDAKKKGIKKMKNRLVAAALLLLLPYIIKLILNIAGRGGSDCIEAMQNLSIFRSNI